MSLTVSFVIPTLNQAAFLPRCIDACLAQRVDHQEVIVVDGGSSDGTVEILRRYGDRIHWVSETDRGQSDAINKGIAKARGDVIAWINSDDYYLHDGVLSRVIEAFDRPTPVDVVYGRGVVVDSEGKVWRSVGFGATCGVDDLLFRPGCFLFQPAVFFRRELFHRVGGLDIDLHFAMDLDLWLRMLDVGAFRCIDEPIAAGTSHPEAKTRAQVGRTIAELRAVKLRYLRRHHAGIFRRVRANIPYCFDLLYWLAVSTGLRRLPKG
jgi:glycosyltransferase involved in cell wall biosynthesis